MEPEFFCEVAINISNENLIYSDAESYQDSRDFAEMRKKKSFQAANGTGIFLQSRINMSNENLSGAKF